MRSVTRISQIMIVLLATCTVGSAAAGVASLWPRPGHVYDVMDVRRGVDRVPSAWVGRTISVRGYTSMLQGPNDANGGSYDAVMLQPLVGEEIARHTLMARYEPSLTVRLTRAQYDALTRTDTNGGQVWNRTPVYPDPLCPSDRVFSFLCGWVDAARMDAAENPFVFRIRIDIAARRTCVPVEMTCYDGDLVAVPTALRG